MPTKRPTIASCPHCRAILLRTERELIHPMASDREELERALGSFWAEHSTTRFDGRFHTCLGRKLPRPSTNDRGANDAGRGDPEPSGHSPYRGPHLRFRVAQPFRRTLLLGILLAGLSGVSAAQEPIGPPPRGLLPSFLEEGLGESPVQALLAWTIRAGRASADPQASDLLRLTAPDLTRILGQLPPPRSTVLEPSQDDGVVLAAAAPPLSTAGQQDRSTEPGEGDSAPAPLDRAVVTAARPIAPVDAGISRASTNAVERSDPLVAAPSSDHSRTSASNRAELGMAGSGLLLILGAAYLRRRSHHSTADDATISQRMTRCRLHEAAALTSPSALGKQRAAAPLAERLLPIAMSPRTQRMLSAPSSKPETLILRQRRAS